VAVVVGAQVSEYGGVGVEGVQPSLVVGGVVAADALLGGVAVVLLEEVRHQFVPGDSAQGLAPARVTQRPGGGQRVGEVFGSGLSVKFLRRHGIPSVSRSARWSVSGTPVAVSNHPY